MGILLAMGPFWEDGIKITRVGVKCRSSMFYRQLSGLSYTDEYHYIYIVIITV